MARFPRGKKHETIGEEIMEEGLKLGPPLLRRASMMTALRLTGLGGPPSRQGHAVAGKKEAKDHQAARNSVLNVKRRMRSLRQKIAKQISRNVLHAERACLTTPFTSSISSTRVDGARISSAARVRVALISCWAGAHLHRSGV